MSKVIFTNSKGDKFNVGDEIHYYSFLMKKCISATIECSPGEWRWRQSKISSEIFKTIEEAEAFEIDYNSRLTGNSDSNV